MIAVFAAVTLSAFAMAGRTDTTFAVGAETRLEIENFAGDVTVRTWGRSAVRIEAEHSSRTSVEISREGPRVSVKSEGRHGVPASVDYRITVPPTVALKISGVYNDVTVEGTRADVEVETVRGDVHVTGGGGHIVLHSVEGEVTLEGGRGRAELSSVNAGITVRDHVGDLSAECVNGEVTLEDIGGATVDASTVNGDVVFDGDTRSGGRYTITTHNGDITVALPPRPDVSVSVTSYSGEFESCFPVKVTSTHRNKRMRFTLGSGSAELELETFQGAIRLDCRGESAASETGRARERKKESDGKKEREP
ncbi:MAG TPA: DUF4097 family beta strand repeat-containing protein [Candidatus Eisenbacteria bacterium]|jgi:hypothetical protein